MKDNLTILVERLKKINIHVKLIGNYPWIYLTEVNSKIVKEKYLANHGFTIAWYPNKNQTGCQLTEIKEIFKILRKYR